MNGCWRPPHRAVTYPRFRGDWTIAHADGTYAAFSPETGRSIVADPRADPKLPALSAALDRGRLVSYRVGRRAVVATESAFVKVVRPSRLANLHEAHRLGEATCSVQSPLVIDAIPSGSVELAPMRGRSIHELLQQGPLKGDVIEALARALARMHHDIDPGQLPHNEPDAPQRWVDTVARVDRQFACHLAGIAARLPDLQPGTASVIHGDLHDKNIFVNASGAGFIDLDGLSLGGAESDLANLAVHIKLRALQRAQATQHASELGALLYRSYASIRPINDEIAVAYEQHTWFRLLCLYWLRTPNRTLSEKIADELLSS